MLATPLSMGNWVMETVRSLGYAGIVGLMFVENVFPPIPSELIMPLAGYLASQASLSLAGVIVAGTVGSVLGALPLYYAGRKLGDERIKRLADRHGRWITLSRCDIEHAERWFERHGRITVLSCRLVPGVRSLISIPAGIERMPLGVFLAYTTVGAALWTALLACLGYVLGQRFHEVERYLDPVTWGVLGGILVFYLYRVVRRRGGEPGRGHGRTA